MPIYKWIFNKHFASHLLRIRTSVWFKVDAVISRKLLLKFLQCCQENSHHIKDVRTHVTLNKRRHIKIRVIINNRKIVIV